MIVGLIRPFICVPNITHLKSPSPEGLLIIVYNALFNPPANTNQKPRLEQGNNYNII